MTRSRSTVIAFALACATAFAVQPGTAGAHEDDDSSDASEEDGTTSESDGEGGAAKGTPARRRAKMNGNAVPENRLRATPPPRPSGRIRLFSLSSKEEVEVNIFNPDGSYNLAAIERVQHILRCRRTDAERPMEPRLFVVLSHLYDHFRKRLDVVSGYRNQRKQTSYHFKGSASDIRVAGVAPKKVRAFAETLDAGGMGIGLYPVGEFVHVDVRPPPSYRWVDYARPNPNNPDKQPPKGWKRRKKLQT